MEKIDILGVKFDNINMNDAVEKCIEYLGTNTSHTIYTPNPEIVMKALENNEFMNILNNASLLVPDGIGIIKAGKILKTPLKERVAGYDLVVNLIEFSKNGNYSFYFWGGKEGVAQKAKENIEKKYPDINILGAESGYFDNSKEAEIISNLKEIKPDILLLGLGAPKQEKILNKYKEDGIYKIGIGCGGTIDGLAGVVKRAPKLFIKLHLEWFYRIIKNPSRWKRALVLPKFVLKVIESKKI